MLIDNIDLFIDSGGRFTMEEIKIESLDSERDKNLSVMKSAKRAKGFYFAICLTAFVITVGLVYNSLVSLVNNALTLASPLISVTAALVSAKFYSKQSGIYKDAVAQEEYFSHVKQKIDSKKLSEELTSIKQKEKEEEAEQISSQVRSETAEERDKREIAEINDFLSK